MFSAVNVFFINNPKIYRILKISFLQVLDDLQICSSNVFFRNNPDLELNPDPKLRLSDPDPKKKKNSDVNCKTTNGSAHLLYL